MDGSIIGETEKAWKIGVHGEEPFWAAKSKCKETGDTIIIPTWMAEQSIHIDEEVCCLLKNTQAGKNEKPPEPKNDVSPVSGGNDVSKSPLPVHQSTQTGGDFRNVKPDEEVTILADRMQLCMREAGRIVKAEFEREGLSKDKEVDIQESIGVSLFIQIGRKY